MTSPDTSRLQARDQEPGTTVTLLSEKDGGLVRRTVLPGGLRIITETMPTVRSVTFGIWVGVGSRDESADLAGATHYLEHLLFKGTERRSALEISAAIDAVGGEMNAFTAKEYTCYYARVLDDDLPLAIDVVCDMVTSSLIREEDVENERGVILEEIAMHEDDPSDAVHDAFAEALLGDSPLGRPILGTVESINSLSRDAIAGYYRERYRPPTLVVAAAGNLDHDEVVRLVQQAFAHVPVDPDARPDAARIGSAEVHSPGAVHLLSRTTEQANLVLGMPGVARTDDRRFALGVLNCALGGGMSSRLFQEVREKRGLAYSVYSYAAHYADLGVFGVYAGCQPKKVDEVLDICRTELQKVAEQGITEEELARGIGQLRGSMVLGLEDTGSRMSRLAKSELVYGELLSVDEILTRIAAVTLDDVRAVARDVLSAKPTLAVIGPFEEGRDFSAAVA
ncbi:insulinase family protein [Carbonactinospora thermoautotrophica]|uniref:Peptidase M16 domain protein n=1 Tax=Carbonactinospora thermoautotrophica TaxID=1469144 RepID=A0A132NG30_9ACTN|nr:Peptidase M16 domain protein [Carbonactinospora thermoautotrophica]KWX04512.1 zinc protease [Carbonactinospora thermoautotrophica]KWX09105.1 zinc protease [Carbonactinospora thermoautotrophica]MCX9191276.1 insulinase family protein [Carbonactinospora thermoautotrophica]